MLRRAFVAAAGMSLIAKSHAAAVPRIASIPVVGVLNESPDSRSRSVASFLQNLRGMGYIEGQNIIVEVRFVAGKAEAFPAFAAEFARRRVDVLVAIGPAALKAASAATTAIPIVALDLETDPVEGGYARSIAHPGGNITGLFLDLPGLTGKWLELTKEAAPAIQRVAILWDSATGPWQLAAAKAAAKKMNLDVQVLEVKAPGDFDAALAEAVKSGSRALVELSSPLVNLSALETRVSTFTIKRRLPTISMFRSFAEAGGLMSYGPVIAEYYRRLAIYVDKILKGTKPADLPIEQPEKFELVINLKTAAALGLTLPQSLLGRADQVIQ
jgi:putative ABC transport system substrate-binding protein